MNRYLVEFFCACPENGLRIKYSLQIDTQDVIKVERILDAVALHRVGFHEAIADRLAETFGGSQTLRAEHHGVTIETTRSK